MEAELVAAEAAYRVVALKAATEDGVDGALRDAGASVQLCKDKISALDVAWDEQLDQLQREATEQERREFNATRSLLEAMRDEVDGLGAEAAAALDAGFATLSKLMDKRNVMRRMMIPWQRKRGHEAGRVLRELTRPLDTVGAGLIKRLGALGLPLHSAANLMPFDYSSDSMAEELHGLADEHLEAFEILSPELAE